MEIRFNNVNILVTGASGLIGSHLIKCMLNIEGIHKIIACARNIEKINILKKEYWNNDSRISLLEWDVSRKNVDIGCTVDYVFHAAGMITATAMREKPVDVINANIQGTINCLEILKHQGRGRLIIFSSATVYGPEGDKERNVTEHDTSCSFPIEDVISTYSESKRMAEVITRAYYRQYDIDVVIGRLSYVYGVSLFGADTAINNFLKLARSKQPIMLNSNIFRVRDYIYVDDAVKGLLLVALQGEAGESYNISSNGEKESKASVYDFARTIVNVINDKDVFILIKQGEEVTQKPGILMDNSKVKALGFEQQYSLEQGILKMFDKGV